MLYPINNFAEALMAHGNRTWLFRAEESKSRCGMPISNGSLAVDGAIDVS